MSVVQTSVTHEDIQVIRQDVIKLSITLSEVHQAIIGNPLTKDGGLVQRLIDLEGDAALLNSRVLSVEKKRIKADLYLRIIWAFGGATLLALFMWVLNNIKN